MQVSGFANGTYYRRVTAVDTQSNTEQSDIWMFKVESTDLNCNMSDSPVDGELCTT
jgi:hypothetical protein